jgi:glycosyltransferase involved in cell wall biosynthesis
MLQGKRIAVTMPAYFAEKTVAKTVADIPREFVDTVILVDDCSKDNTYTVAQSLGIIAYRNDPNQNYGGNVKRCLQYALDEGADIVIQLHPDYQYTPKLTLPMAAMLATGNWDLCLGVRTSGKGARGTMPLWRYLPNVSRRKPQRVPHGLSRLHTRAPGEGALPQLQQHRHLRQPDAYRCAARRILHV